MARWTLPALVFGGLVIGSLPDWIPARIIVVALGLVYCIAAGFGWAAENRRDMLASEGGVEHGSAPAE